MATAGHVDHGKTSLIKHLTGIDTDRLEEEKRRGLSINLGFAYRKLPGHSPIGFVDVPGHNRFINTMISGVSGIDLGMLVVAADDGPMPQTIEHLDVLRLLGVQNIVLVVTKIDRVPPARVQEVETQMQALLAVKEGRVPAFPVSNNSGEGVAALISYLEQRARDEIEKPAVGGFRLSIDRAFNLKGVGMVVTGTATAGSVSVDDFVVLQPSAIKLRVRSVHVQDEKADRACAGQRCALNVVGDIEKSAVARGDWLLDINAGPVSSGIDARVRLLDNAPFPLKHLSPVKIYLGARRVAGRLFILEGGRRLDPGADALVQLLLDDAVSCCHGERFLLRDDSESVTLGGGRVLDPYAPRTGKSRPQRLGTLRALDTDSPQAALETLVVEQGQLLDLEKFRHSWNLRTEEMENVCGPSLHRIEASAGSLLVSAARWQQGLDTIPEYLASWHQRNPHEDGIEIQQLSSGLAITPEAPLLAALLGDLMQHSVVTLKSGRLSLAGYRASVSSKDVEHWRKWEAFLLQRGNDLPLLSQVATQTGLTRKTLEKIARIAVNDGRLHKLTDTRYATPQQLAKLAQLVSDLVDDGQPITVINFKQRMGTGRKLAIEVLEYFDSIRFTRRSEDDRVILDAELPARLFNR
ncbi:MAG: selenocysteine-specific translation elongation factor [Halioglobus sp.]|nr:selenocysteine-specific translation elongation factor [Halioglobus sp.]